jgi:HPt (histidine-containing phosphotransfer) domain-containing protein
MSPVTRPWCAKCWGYFPTKRAILARVADAPGDTWRNAAHSLKGSALGIGAFALAQACSDAESARDASPEVKRAILARVADALGDALADIAAYTRG